MVATELWLISAGFVVFGLAFAGVGVLLVYYGRRIRRRNAEIEATETTAVGEIEPGEVVIEGTAEPIEDAGTVEAVATGESGLATTFEVERYASRGSHNYDTIYEHREAVPFLVDDGTGEVRIDPPTDGEFDFEVGEQTVVPVDEEPPERIRQFVDGAAVDEAATYEIGGLQMGERRRFTEGLLVAGEDVVVRGEVREADAGWGERGYVLDGGADHGSFLLSNKPRDQLASEGDLRAVLLYAAGGMTVLGGLICASVPLLILLLATLT